MLKLLLIEPVGELAAGLVPELGARGFDVDVASGGREALESLDRVRPDVVLISDRIEDLTPLELGRRLGDLGAAAGRPTFGALLPRGRGMEGVPLDFRVRESLVFSQVAEAVAGALGEPAVPPLALASRGEVRELGGRVPASV